MPSPLEIQAAAVLYAAIETPNGIVVRTDNVYRARAVLYRFRKELGDLTLAELQVRISPDDPEHELWLIRRGGTAAANATLTEGEAIAQNNL